MRIQNGASMSHQPGALRVGPLNPLREVPDRKGRQSCSETLKKRQDFIHWSEFNKLLVLPASNRTPGLFKDLLTSKKNNAWLLAFGRLKPLTAPGLKEPSLKNPWRERQLPLVELGQKLRYSVARLASVRCLIYHLITIWECDSVEFKLADMANLHRGY